MGQQAGGTIAEIGLFDFNHLKNCVSGKTLIRMIESITIHDSKSRSKTLQVHNSKLK